MILFVMFVLLVVEGEQMTQFTSTQVAVGFSVTRDTIHRWVEGGQLKPSKLIGLRKIMRFDQQEIDRFARENQLTFDPPSTNTEEE